LQLLVASVKIQEMQADKPSHKPGAGRLINPQYETFARARSRGLTQLAAYEGAGYSSNASLASALANDPEVKARIDWLARREEALAAAAAEPTLLALLALVEAGGRAPGAACAKETRLTLRAARELQRELAAPLQTAEPEPAPACAPGLERLDNEAWKAKYGPGGWYWAQNPRS
jgi:hypothetical protein